MSACQSDIERGSELFAVEEVEKHAVNECFVFVCVWLIGWLVGWLSGWVGE